MALTLKNYRTGIAAEKSIVEIEALLCTFGANAIMKEYGGDGKISSLAFKYQNNSYKLPANPEGIYEVLFGKTRTSYKQNAMANREIQAYNVAWRLMKDWVYTQLSIIVAKQATPEQIMLPFMWDGKRTFFQAYEEGRVGIVDKSQNGQD